MAMEIELSRCPFDYVIAYRNQARIYRTVEIPITPEVHTLKIKGFPESCCRDSLSVLPTSPLCTVKQLSTRKVSARRKGGLTRINELFSEVKALEMERKKLSGNCEVIARMRRVLSDHVRRQLTATPSDICKDHVGAAYSEKEKSMTEMLAWENEKGMELEGRESDAKKKETECRLELMKKLRQLLDLIEDRPDRCSRYDYDCCNQVQRVREDMDKSISFVAFSHLPWIDLLIKSLEIIEVLEVEIEFTVDHARLQDSSIAFNIEYQTPKASWEPSYDVRIDDSPEATASVTFYGTIRQNTQEDWDGVSIRLSTCNLSECASVPPLPRLEVDFETDKPSPRVKRSAVGGFRRLKAKADVTDSVQSSSSSLRLLSATNESVSRLMNLGVRVSESHSSDGEEDAGCVEGETAEETVLQDDSTTTGSSSLTYIIEGKVTVPCDNQEYRVKAGSFEVKAPLCKVTRYAVPAESRTVFVLVEVVNGSSYDLLGSNKVFCYLNGTYVGTTQLNKPHVVTGDKFNLSFGQDHAASLSYVSSKMTKEEGFFEKTKSEHFKATTHLDYAARKDAHCVLIYAMPVSSAEKIKIKMISPPSGIPEIDEAGDREAALKASSLCGANGRASFRNSSNNHIYEVVPLLSNGDTPTRGSAKLEQEYIIEWPSDKHLNRQFAGIY